MNVLFGNQFDEERYWNVLKICGLHQDIQKFEHGDQTYVGERGVVLSGGQKARFSLARAIYRNTNIYLLDDPLSGMNFYSMIWFQIQLSFWLVLIFERFY